MVHVFSGFTIKFSMERPLTFDASVLFAERTVQLVLTRGIKDEITVRSWAALQRLVSMHKTIKHSLVVFFKLIIRHDFLKVNLVHIFAATSFGA
jgi:hypothetical protein